jgi:hypothetical protein
MLRASNPRGGTFTTAGFCVFVTIGAGDVAYLCGMRGHQARALAFLTVALVLPFLASCGSSREQDGPAPEASAPRHLDVQARNGDRSRSVVGRGTVKSRRSDRRAERRAGRRSRAMGQGSFPAPAPHRSRSRSTGRRCSAGGVRDTSGRPAAVSRSAHAGGAGGLSCVPVTTACS